MKRKNSRAAAGAGTIRQRSDGTWEGRLSLGGGERRSFYGSTQSEVRKKMTEAQRSIDNGTYHAPNKITVGEWLDTWYTAYCVPRVKPLTLACYEVVIRVHLKPKIGKIRLQDLKGVHVQQIYNDMIAAGRAPKTVKNAAAVLHKALSIAVKQGYIPFNPADAAELPRDTQKEIKPLTDSEIPLFLNAIEDSPYRNSYALCLFAGLREAECLGLSWDCVDFEEQTLTIKQQLMHERKKGAKYYIASSTKSGKPRTIRPPAIAFQYLRAEWVKQAERRLAAGERWSNPDNLVFTNELGGNVSTVTFYNTFKRLVAKIGRPDLRVHDLRHTAATVAIASGADIKSVQDLLGHATATFTLNVYAHTSDAMRKDTAARVQGYYDNLIEKKA